MFDPVTLPALRTAIRERTNADRRLLDELCAEVRSFANRVRSIKARSATCFPRRKRWRQQQTAIRPFYVHLIRVVDSYGKQLCFDAVSPTTDTDELSRGQFNPDGSPRTSLGRMMFDLDVKPRRFAVIGAKMIARMG